MFIHYFFMCIFLFINPSFGTLHKSADKVSSTNGTTTEVPEQYFEVAQLDWKSVQTPFIIALWILLACFAKLGFHLSKSLTSVFPDSSLLIMLGLLVGIIIFATTKNHSSQISLEHDLFFIYLLPPIVFDAGYFMPNRQFFDNIGTILTFAIIGTIWNVITIGISLWYVGTTGLFSIQVPLFHAMVFSSLISSTDPVAVLTVFDEIHVNEMLYIVVFGESLLNDAVGVVLYEMFVSYSEIAVTGPIETVDIVNGFLAFFVVGLGGVAVGIIWAALISFTTRWTGHVRYLEPLFVFVMAYCSYLTGQMFALSGIMAIVFCGLAMKQYVEGNISHKSQTTIKYIVKTLSLCAETIIFMFLGLSTISSQAHWDTAFVCLTILFCLVYRAIGVVFLSFCLNKKRLSKLDTVDQFVLSYGGLRGAMVYGLVSSLDESVVPAKRMFVTTTIVVIYFSVFVQGMTIKPLVNFLKVKRADVRDIKMQEQVFIHVADHAKAGMEQILGCHGHNWFREKWEFLNSRYIKRVLNRQSPKTIDAGIVESFTRINVREAVDHLARYGSFHSTSAIRSLTSLMRQHQSFDNNLFSNNVKKNSLTASAPMLDMKVFDARPGKKQGSAVRRHHAAVDGTFRPKAKQKANKVPPIETNFMQIGHYAQPYKVQNVFDKNVRPKFDKKEKKKKGVHFDNDAFENEETALPATITINDETQSNGEEYEMTAVERELPWLRELETSLPPETNFCSFGNESFLTVAEKILPWKEIESPPISPTRSAFSTKSAKEVEQSKIMTIAERELPWKRLDETEFVQKSKISVIEEFAENDIEGLDEVSELNDDSVFEPPESVTTKF